jgi:hypothetical protein
MFSRFGARREQLRSSPLSALLTNPDGRLMRVRRIRGRGAARISQFRVRSNLDGECSCESCRELSRRNSTPSCEPSRLYGIVGLLWLLPESLLTLGAPPAVSFEIDP